jgi:hypothetical protein
MMNLLRAAFWLALVFIIIQPLGSDFDDSPDRLAAIAVETGRSAALDGLDRLACKTIECTGARLAAQSLLTPAMPIQTESPTTDAPHPASLPVALR